MQRAARGEPWNEAPAPRGGTWMVLLGAACATIIAPPAVAFTPGEGPEDLAKWRTGTWPLDEHGWLARRPETGATTEVLSTAAVLARLPAALHVWVEEIMRLQLAQLEAFATPQAGGLSDEERSRTADRKLVALRAELRDAFPHDDWYQGTVDAVPPVPETSADLLAAIDGWASEPPVQPETVFMAAGCSGGTGPGHMLTAARADQLARAGGPADELTEPRIGATQLRETSGASDDCIVARDEVARPRVGSRPRSGAFWGRKQIVLGLCTALSIGALAGFSIANNSRPVVSADPTFARAELSQRVLLFSDSSRSLDRAERRELLDALRHDSKIGLSSTDRQSGRAWTVWLLRSSGDDASVEAITSTAATARDIHARLQRRASPRDTATANTSNTNTSSTSLNGVSQLDIARALERGSLTSDYAAPTANARAGAGARFSPAE